MLLRTSLQSTSDYVGCSHYFDSLLFHYGLLASKYSRSRVQISGRKAVPSAGWRADAQRHTVAEALVASRPGQAGPGSPNVRTVAPTSPSTLRCLITSFPLCSSMIFTSQRQ